MEGKVGVNPAEILSVQTYEEVSTPHFTIQAVPMDGEIEEIEAAHHGQSSAFELHDTLIGKIAEKIHVITCIITLPLMALVIGLEVIFRYALGSGFRWSQEACCISLLILVIGCQANCWQKDRHIRMDLLYNRAGKFYRTIVNVMILVCGGIFFGSLMLQAIQEIPYQLSINEATEEIYFPLWILNAIIVVSCACFIAALCRYAFRMIWKK